MQKVLDFIIQNWRLLLEVFCAIIALVLFICRKKPVKVLDTVKECISRLLPYVIKEAEKTDLKGEDKMVFALQTLYALLKDFGYEEVYNNYRDFAREQIELILSTPQKKEVSKSEK